MIEQYDDMNILNAVWCGQIGMVLVENQVTNERKVYVGQIAGHNVDSDIMKLCNDGDKLHPESIKTLFEHFGGEINPEADWGTALKHFETQVFPESVFPEPTQERTDALDDQHKKYLTAASGSMARKTCGLIREKVQEIRQLRKEVSEGRADPDQHPSKREDDING